jgi:hypothetical protein
MNYVGRKQVHDSKVTMQTGGKAVHCLCMQPVPSLKSKDE